MSEEVRTRLTRESGRNHTPPGAEEGGEALELDLMVRGAAKAYAVGAENSHVVSSL